jgi:ABC-type sulfate transport system permease component
MYPEQLERALVIAAVILIISLILLIGVNWIAAI